MKLKSGYPYWAVKNGLMHAFPRLERDAGCEVAVVGGGISGALVANELAAHGHEVCVVEARDIGWGSTAASTALLQYETDTHMTELAERLGEADAALVYRACADAIGMLRELATEVGDVGFASMRSLYWASRRRDLESLQQELALRARHGLAASWIGPGELRDAWGLEAPGAILSSPAARIDPYRMTCRVLARLERMGVPVYDRTHIARLEPRPRGVRLHTDDGACLRARNVVLATGYEAQAWLAQRVARNRSTYAFITDPMPAGTLRGLDNTLLWETARPYLYLRGTDDHRMLVGGADDALDIPRRRDLRVGLKTRQLLRQAARVLPDLELGPTFAWGGTFAETGDGLPFFGPHPQHGRHVHFAMAYGGNGITYSMLGARLIRALLERRRHRLLPLFSFARLERTKAG
ncbi:MAG TPA: FAD-dependent oxidoreductase [Rhodanobacter sp.]|nr:FAD-dependent oxidoreductase [Rhodanobacter sp.]